MKSFACVVMGMAMIAVVVPVESLLAAPGTYEHSRCEQTQNDPSEYPPTLFCDYDSESCNSSTKVYYNNVGECVDGGAECFTSCTEWTGVSYQSYTVKTKPTLGLPASQFGLALAGGALCFYAVGFVGALICAGGVYFVGAGLINRCDFIPCTVDWTISPTPGPIRGRCN